MEVVSFLEVLETCSGPCSGPRNAVARYSIRNIITITPTNNPTQLKRRRIEGVDARTAVLSCTWNQKENKVVDSVQIRMLFLYSVFLFGIFILSGLLETYWTIKDLKRSCFLLYLNICR